MLSLCGVRLCLRTRNQRSNERVCVRSCHNTFWYNCRNSFNKDNIKVMKLYIFISSEAADKLSQIVCFAHTAEKALKLAELNFKKNNYKGRPVALAV